MLYYFYIIFTKYFTVYNFRDLISWCSRISMDFDHTSPDSPARIFQAALDCFVACLSNPSKRLPLAEAIAAKLGITKDKVCY